MVRISVRSPNLFSVVPKYNAKIVSLALEAVRQQRSKSNLRKVPSNIR